MFESVHHKKSLCYFRSNTNSNTHSNITNTGTALERTFGIDQVAELDVELEHIIFKSRKMTLVGNMTDKEDVRDFERRETGDT